MPDSLREQPTSSSQPGFLSAARAGSAEPIIHLPALGMAARVRSPGAASEGFPTVIENMIAAGSGPLPLRRTECEIFHVVTGRFLFEIDGRRFVARRGDLVFVPGGAARACVNITGTGARQQVTIYPGIDADGFLRGLAAATAPDGHLEPSGLADWLRALGLRTGVEFLGPPLWAQDLPLAESPAF